MRFKEGDKVIYGGYEVEIIKQLPNSNRYKINSSYAKGYMVDKELVHKDLKEYYEYQIRFFNKRMEVEKNKYMKDKEFFEKKIKESKEYLDAIQEIEE